MSPPPGTPDDAWELFCAAADGHLPTIQRLIAQDGGLIHYEIWYEFPLHFAVRGGHLEAVRLLLEAGTNPAQSRFNYSSWQTLLSVAAERGFDDIHALLVESMQTRFEYHPAFESLRTPIVDHDLGTAAEVIAQQPELVHAGDVHGNRGLHWAVLVRHPGLIDLLLAAGADINARRADLLQPIHLTMEGDYHNGGCAKFTDDCGAIREQLLSQGADYDIGIAAYRGDLDRLREILAGDPTAAQRLTPARRSPLFYAAHGRQLEAVRLLLAHGADPNLDEHCAPRGKALFVACDHRDVDMVSLLLAHGADPNAEVDSSGNCLSIAQYRPADHTAEVVALLTDHGAQVGLWQFESAAEVQALLEKPDEIRDPTCWPGLLNVVVNADDLDALEIYVKHFGTEAIARMTPENDWCRPQSAEILDALIAHGMDINRPDWFGRTFLHYCAQDPTTVRAEMLLDRGIHIDAIDVRQNATALGLAANQGNESLVRFLLSRGADPKQPEGDEWAAPARLAAAGGHAQIVAILSAYA